MTVVISGTAGIQNVLGSAAAPSNTNVTSTNTGVYFPTSTTLGIATAGVNAVTVDASQNVGIGTSSPAQKLDVVGSGKATSSFAVGDSSGNLSGSMVNESDVSKSITFNADPANVGTNSFMRWNVDGTERMRIDSSGNLLVGTTANLSSSGKAQIAQPSGTTGTAVLSLDALSTSYAYTIAYLNTNTVAGSGFSFIRCTTGGYAQSRFLVVGNGDVQNTNNSYGAISDVKLKENIVDATPKLVDLMQVKIRNYNLIGETTKQIGVVAQELEQVFPNMVVELADKDADNNDVGTTTKSVKYSVFVPMLIKCIQEQQALITSLTARIEALEAK